MGSFFRRYVGGDVAFDPYMTGELGEDGVSPQIPVSACPTSTSGTRIPCVERILVSYFAEPVARRDVLRPETDNPLDGERARHVDHRQRLLQPVPGRRRRHPGPGDHGGRLRLVQPRADPLHAVVARLHRPADRDQGLPAARRRARSAARAATRENAPVNHSYGLQLALAWDQPASIGTRVPAASGDVTRLQDADAWARRSTSSTPATPPAPVTRSGTRRLTTQDFSIVLVDKAGKEGVVPAASPRYGNALHQTTGLDDRPHAHRAQRDPRPAERLRGPGRRSHEHPQGRAALRRGRQAGHRARSSSPTSASRRPSAARRSTPTSSPTSRRPPPAAEAAASEAEAASRAGDGRGGRRGGGGAAPAAPSCTPPRSRSRAPRSAAARSSSPARSTCATTVRVTISRVGSARGTKAVRAKRSAQPLVGEHDARQGPLPRVRHRAGAAPRQRDHADHGHAA